MIKEIGSKGFEGFYNSIFDSSEDFIDYEGELKGELEDKCIDEGIDFDMENIEISMEYIDWNEYKQDVADKFVELYVEKVIDVLPVKILDNPNFKFELVDNTVKVSSPKFYNYYTDRIYWNVETNYETLNLIKEYVLGLNGVKEYIKENFKSCEGYVSFISNDFEYWKSLSIVDFEDIMLIAMLDMLLRLSEEDIFEDINMSTEEAVCKYEYVEPYVYYNGGSYKLNDFCKKVFNE